jgi:2-polyprenyl-6-methoxyphenol hydroxylase-like FAD-dependent oxidoreductase
VLPVVVIGAGPVGLAAAAHLLERGLEPLVLERGDDVATNVADWAHVRVFSPWSFNRDDAAVRLLESLAALEDGDVPVASPAQHHGGADAAEAATYDSASGTDPGSRRARTRLRVALEQSLGPVSAAA